MGCGTSSSTEIGGVVFHKDESKEVFPTPVIAESRQAITREAQPTPQVIQQQRYVARPRSDSDDDTEFNLYQMRVNDWKQQQYREITSEITEKAKKSYYQNLGMSNE